MVDPNDIVKWQRINARLTSSGQPREEQLASLRELGVSHVVNLALHDHEKALADEAERDGVQAMSELHMAVAMHAGHAPDAEVWGDGRDRAHQRPFALVIVSGLFSRLLISIYLMPALYALVARPDDRLEV